MNSFTVTGNVAEYSRICLFLGMKLMSCEMTGWNSGESSLSASSITSIVACCSFATPFDARSTRRPGVATTMCTG